MAGAYDSSDFAGYNNIVGSDDNEKKLTSGFKNIKFKTEETFIDSISLMGNKMISSATARLRKIHMFLI